VKRLGWVLFFLAIIYFIFLIRQDIIDQIDLRREAERAANKVEEAEKRGAMLRDRSHRLKGDDLIEEIARTRLGLVKKGETAYKVIR